MAASFTAVLLVVAGLALSGCAATPHHRPAHANACKDAGPAIVCTEQGAIRATTEGNTPSFKSIPYAKPPVDSLRWHPPEPPVARDGVRDGSRFGAICPQIAGNGVAGEEDCLSLDIWRPRERAGAPLPVMVSFTGGGNHEAHCDFWDIVKLPWPHL